MSWVDSVTPAMAEPPDRNIKGAEGVGALILINALNWRTRF